MITTNQQYDQVILNCMELFLNKARDYGASWRVLRTISIVDQIYIKAKRIRTIQENGMQKVSDDIPSEFAGIVNYGIIGLIQSASPGEETELPVETVKKWYEIQVAEAKTLMQNKNFDYGEAWRDMSLESFTDLIMVKLLRVRQILINKGKTIASEGIDANFLDIINYGVFALILIGESKHKEKA